MASVRMAVDDDGTGCQMVMNRLSSNDRGGGLATTIIAPEFETPNTPRRRTAVHPGVISAGGNINADSRTFGFAGSASGGHSRRRSRCSSAASSRSCPPVRYFAGVSGHSALCLRLPCREARLLAVRISSHADQPGEPA